MERVVAFLDKLLTFKLANIHLIRTREVASHLLQSEHYRWMYSVLKSLVKEATPEAAKDQVGYTTHALLFALHMELIDELLAVGYSIQSIRQRQAAYVKSVLAGF